MIATTISSSISEKPFCFRIVISLLFSLMVVMTISGSTMALEGPDGKVT
jgi:uncharacterized membrane protein